MKRCCAACGPGRPCAGASWLEWLRRFAHSAPFRASVMALPNDVQAMHHRVPASPLRVVRGHASCGGLQQHVPPRNVHCRAWTTSLIALDVTSRFANCICLAFFFGRFGISVFSPSCSAWLHTRCRLPRSPLPITLQAPSPPRRTLCRHARRYDTGLSVMARANDADIATQALNTLQGTGAIFFNLLALLVIAVMMMAVVLFSLERSSPGSRPVIRRGCCTGLKDSGVLIMLLLAGVDIRLPSGRCSRPAGALCSMCSGLLAILVTAMSTVVLQSASNTFSIQSFADLSRRTVIAVGGTIGEQYVEANGINVNILPVATVDDMFARFEAGDADALFYDKPILSAYIARDTAATGSERFALRGQIHLQQQYGIALAPQLGREAKKAVDRAILSFYGSDEFKVLQARWLGVSLETSETPAADPASVTRFLEDYFWLIAMGGGAIIGVALLVGVVGLAVRYQMNREAKASGVGEKSLWRRAFVRCFGKDQERGMASDKIAELKRARRGSATAPSHATGATPGLGSSVGDVHSVRAASLAAAEHSSRVQRACCFNCIWGSTSDRRAHGGANRVAPANGQHSDAGTRPVCAEFAAAAHAQAGAPLVGQQGGSTGVHRLAWGLDASGGASPADPWTGQPLDRVKRGGEQHSDIPAIWSRDLEGHEDADTVPPVRGVTASMRATHGLAVGDPDESAPETGAGRASVGQAGSLDHVAASGENLDVGSNPWPSRMARASESAGPSASDVVAKAFWGIKSGKSAAGSLLGGGAGGGDCSTTAGSSVHGGSSNHGGTEAEMAVAAAVPGAAAARFGGGGAGFGASLGITGHSLMRRLETSPTPATGGLAGWRPTETPRTAKTPQDQTKTLSKQAVGIEAALANLSFRLPKPGERGGAGGGGGSGGGQSGVGGLVLPAGASLEMDADERLFLKREQWRLRYASRLAPILPPNDLIWMIYERVDILTQQALLQRAMGRLDVPADLEEVSPRDLTGDAEEIRVFLVSKGVAAREAASLAVLVAMGGTMNDRDEVDDGASLTLQRKTHRVMGGAGADTVIAADRSSKAPTMAVPNKPSSALRRLQLQAKIVGSLVAAPPKASGMLKAPALKTAGSAKKPFRSAVPHRSGSVGPIPQRSGSRSELAGSSGLVGREGRPPARKPAGEAASGTGVVGDAEPRPRGRSRKHAGGRSTGKSGRSKSSKSRRKTDKADK